METPPFQRKVSTGQSLAESTQFVDLRHLRGSSVDVQVAVEADLDSDSSPGCQRQAVDRSVGPTTSGSISSPRSIHVSLEAVQTRLSPRDASSSGQSSLGSARHAAEERRTFARGSPSPATPLSTSHGTPEGNGSSPVLRTERGASPILVPSFGTCTSLKRDSIVEKDILLAESSHTERSSVSEGSSGSVSSGEVFQDLHRGRILAYFSHSVKASCSHRVSVPAHGNTETPFRPRAHTNTQFTGWLGHQVCRQSERRESHDRSATGLDGTLLAAGNPGQKHQSERTSNAPPEHDLVQPRAHILDGTRNTFGRSFGGGGQVLLQLSDGRLAPAKEAGSLFGLLSPGEVVEGERPAQEERDRLQEATRHGHQENLRMVSSPAFTSPGSSESLSSGEVQPNSEQPPLPASPVVSLHEVTLTQQSSRDRSPLSSNAPSRCSMAPLALPATNIGPRPISSSLNSPRSPIHSRVCCGKSLAFSDSAGDKLSRVSDRKLATPNPVPASSHAEENARQHVVTDPGPAPSSWAESRPAGTPHILERCCKASSSDGETHNLAYSQFKAAHAKDAQIMNSLSLASLRSARSDKSSDTPCPSFASSPPRGFAVSSPKGLSQRRETAAFLVSRGGEKGVPGHSPPSDIEELPDAESENRLDSPRRASPDRATALRCAVSAICALATTSFSPHRLPSLPDSPQQVPLPFLLSPTTAEADASCPGDEFPAKATHLVEGSELTFGSPVPGWQ
nr:conserved hypothetical protein [Neospora caninum Liverpool]CBZ56228.1 conserved hypothetical protein [Neospora caninum Liverpool]|eukprot:XP_003886253.1 conserved hypothetical protein [Neospora caninum Liverpool]